MDNVLLLGCTRMGLFILKMQNNIQTLLLHLSSSLLTTPSRALILVQMQDCTRCPVSWPQMRSWAAAPCRSACPSDRRVPRLFAVRSRCTACITNIHPLDLACKCKTSSWRNFSLPAVFNTDVIGSCLWLQRSFCALGTSLLMWPQTQPFFSPVPVPVKA